MGTFFLKLTFPNKFICAHWQALIMQVGCDPNSNINSKQEMISFVSQNRTRQKKYT